MHATHGKIYIVNSEWGKGRQTAGRQQGDRQQGRKIIIKEEPTSDKGASRITLGGGFKDLQIRKNWLAMTLQG